MQIRRTNTVAFAGILILPLIVLYQHAPAQVATAPFDGAMLSAEQITDSVHSSRRELTPSQSHFTAAMHRG
jgi:hypothetical protein